MKKELSPENFSHQNETNNKENETPTFKLFCGKKIHSIEDGLRLSTIKTIGLSNDGNEKYALEHAYSAENSDFAELNFEFRQTEKQLEDVLKINEKLNAKSESLSKRIAQMTREFMEKTAAVAMENEQLHSQLRKVRVVCLKQQEIIKTYKLKVENYVKEAPEMRNANLVYRTPQKNQFDASIGEMQVNLQKILQEIKSQENSTGENEENLEDEINENYEKK